MKRKLRRILNYFGYDIRAVSEVEENWCALGRLPSVDVVIDVGVAQSTKILLERFPKAKHYLFEPILEFNDTIKKNYTNVDYELHNLACSDISGEVEFFLDSTFLSNSRVSEFDEIKQSASSINIYRTKSTRLDEFFTRDDNRISTQKTLLKIDVEGHELNVMSGARQILEYIDYVIIEISCEEPNNLGKMFEFMLTCGFTEITVLYAHRWDNKYQALDMLFTQSSNFNS